ncbi:vesicular integral-membrane protein VIP36-like isoform X2 [Ruditapes philippinarum]|uniref:vesicular integral-membrane protein VIP36-like isoform X2 n=1 Tax=Ruditapes philippinarum TaxID=129788 RepID=UPI00295AA91F|nr:vesicular integral-membrane protein VIP36-like isoform X2 [Ruditapes philippinarum]
MASDTGFILRTLFILLISCLVKATWNTKDYLKREHTITKPYTGAGMNIPLWDFVGTTMVTSNYIRLTPDRQSSQGAIWNTMPCRVRNWELHVHFKVHGQGKNLFGDGFAIWYARDRNQLGPVFGSKDYFVGLAVIADTYSNHNGPHNHQHPYISSMVNNGSMHYDHDLDGTHTELAGCTSLFRNSDHDTYLAIRYEGTTLKVSMDVDGKDGWTECFKVDGVRLPVGYYFGASAATGELADNHDIISMKLYELDLPESGKEEEYRGLPQAEVFAAPRDHIDDPKGGFTSGGSWSGWKIFFVIVLIIIGVIVCGAVAFVIFNKDDPTKRKRFY